jgi:CheY-like chemotaxis protein
MPKNNAVRVVLGAQNLSPFLSSRMHKIPHQLHVVDDGGGALDYLILMGESSEKPCLDLMLLDLNLPSADGPEILRALRKHRRAPTCRSS